MAIQWGAWEGGTNQRLRIGIDVSWEAISHGEVAATATIKVYLDVDGQWSDTQTITLTGSASGSVTFSNNQNNNSVLRKTDTYPYNYGNKEYGGSPGSRTFGAKLSGSYNGASPSKSVSSNIPGRPYGSPASPTNVNTTRVSEGSAKTTWTNRDTAGEPWGTVRIQVDAGDNNAWNGDAGTTSGGGTSFTDTGLSSNYAYRWRVRSENSVGNSAWVEGDLIYTTPAVPSSVTRTGLNGANQVITWNNWVNDVVDHRIAVERSINGGSWNQIVETGRNSTTYTDTYPATHPSDRFRYRVRSRTNGGAQGTLYSAYSNTTSETTGVTTPPNAPTNLSPAGNTVINPNFSKVLTWQHHSTDTSAQTGYQIQWRVVGAGSWTVRAKVLSATPTATLAAGTFPDTSNLEWQVRTWGATSTGGSDGTGASPFSASALFKTVGDPNLFRERKRVMRLDLDTGQPESAPVGVLPPIGSMMMFGGVSAPSGWLLCQGQAVLRSAYLDLFGVIGIAFGAGDGSTTFNLPDMRVRLPIGAGTSVYLLGATDGNGAESDRQDRMQHSHTHGVGNVGTNTSGSGHTHTLAEGTIASTTTVGGSFNRLTGGGSTGSSGSGHTHGVTGTTDSKGTGTTGNWSVHAYTALNYLIKT